MSIEISAMEKERTRIAADLHDDLAPLLSVVKFQIDNVDFDNPDDQQGLQEASSHLDEISKKLREISNNLMPSVLIRKGLVAAISELITRVEKSYDINISFTYIQNLVISEEHKIHLYRIMQELLHNTIKHAAATSVTVELNGTAEKLSLLYRDNGKGFDYPKVAKDSTGIGLRSLTNRTELIDGSIIIESKQDNGSAFLFTIPLKHKIS